MGFPCQRSDRMTKAAGGDCALSYSDVKYEALSCNLVLYPEVLAPLASKAWLFPGACSRVKEVLCG